MQHLKAAGSRQRVVISQNIIPFLGKSGTPLMEFATSSFFSSSNIAAALCCPDDTTRARLERRAAGGVCGGPTGDVLLKPDRGSNDVSRCDNMRRDTAQAASAVSNYACWNATRSFYEHIGFVIPPLFCTTRSYAGFQVRSRLS